MTKNNIKSLTISALFLALGFILPMLTGQVPVIGKMLLPMHIPVLLCGFICGPKHGATIGFTLPLMRSLIFSVPVMYPTAIAVAFEMSVYGLLTGLLYNHSQKKSAKRLYFTMLSAMILGRVVRCIAEIILLGIKGSPFVLKAFITGTILNAIPGIVIQLVLIPAIVIISERVGALKIEKTKNFQ